ncbi:putative receptor tyrosine phosphatase type r2a [Fasciolopsis buskii]|uniref:Putative receptor tyrosine phosphatase type r2a n=1 Tax=Fasciolopsis buskii TaxID=27845 RepID=A0A8E0SAG9_9TREM|nr:putative receptor tyrosine phosphatase type r2a [Fasciolopsis buski]
MWDCVGFMLLLFCPALTALPPDASVPFILNSNPCLVDPSICFEVPSAPRNLRLNQLRRALPPGVTDPSAEYAVLELAWDPPERSHGDLRGYQVSHRLIGPPEVTYSQRGTTDAGPQKPIRRNVTQTAYTSTLADGLSKLTVLFDWW